MSLQDHVAITPTRARAHETTRRGGSFGDGVSALLARTQYVRCVKDEDFKSICKLRYDSYSAAGMALASEQGSISDDFDLTDNCYCFGIMVDSVLVATVRLHHLSREHPYSPSMNAFPDILSDRVAAGETFIDPGRFAADPTLAGSYRLLPFVALRLAVLASDYFQATSCLSFVQEVHAAFYRRVFGSRTLADPRYVQIIDGDVMLLESPPRDLYMAATYERYPFFRPAEGEADRLFSPL